MENNTNNFEELKKHADESHENDFIDETRAAELDQPETQAQTEPGNQNPPPGPENENTYKEPDGKVNLGEMLGEDAAKQIAIGIDFALSGAMALLATKIAKRPVYMENFRQTASEINNFKTCVHECLKTIKLDLSNPWIILGILTVGTYGAKAANITTEIMAEKMNSTAAPIQKGKRGTYKKRNPKEA